MKDLLIIINHHSELKDFSTEDFKLIKEYMHKNNLDTDEIDKFINDTYQRCNKFATELSNKFNSLSEDQIKSINILNENNIKWELKSDWDYDSKKDTYKIVVDNKEEGK